MPTVSPYMFPRSLNYCMSKQSPFQYTPPPPPYAMYGFPQCPYMPARPTDSGNAQLEELKEMPFFPADIKAEEQRLSSALQALNQKQSYGQTDRPVTLLGRTKEPMQDRQNLERPALFRVEVDAAYYARLYAAR